MNSTNQTTDTAMEALNHSQIEAAVGHAGVWPEGTTPPATWAAERDKQLHGAVGYPGMEASKFYDDHGRIIDIRKMTDAQANAYQAWRENATLGGAESYNNAFDRASLGKLGGTDAAANDGKSS
jgi:hypothetical protein